MPTTSKNGLKKPTAKKAEETTVVVDTEATETAELQEEEVTEGVVMTGVDVEEKTAPPPPKMVRIKMRDDHRCHIGGQSYVLEKGKCYNVPENVKNVLTRAELLLPL